MARSIHSSAAAWRRRWTAYLFAGVISGLTLAVRASLAPWIGQRPLLILFMLPIIISAYAGGIGPGLLATAISAAGIYYFLLSGVHILWFEGSVDLWAWVMLMVNGALVSLVVEALHRSRRQVEAAGQLQAVTLSSIGDAVITTDSQGRVTFLNAEAERLTEWSNSDAQGRPMAEVFRVVNEDTRLPVEDPVLKVLRTGATVGLANHTMLVGRHGRETLIDDSGAPIKESNGRVAGVVLIFRDCTDNKKSAEALRESQALYHSLVEQMPAGVFRKDAAGRYVLVNSYFCQFRGITPEQFLGKLPGELPDSEAAFKIQGAEHHNLVMRTGKPVEVLDKYIHPDGRTRYFHVVKTPVFDGNGNITGSQGVLFDVTERKKAEEAVVEREQLLRQVIDAVPHFIFAKDRQSRNLFVNLACAAANNLTVEEMVGKSDADFLVDRAQAEIFMREDREVIDSGRAKFIAEEVVTNPDGSRRILETLKFPFKMPGLNEPALLGVAVDVTAKKLAEEQLRREEVRFRLIFDTVPIGIAFRTMQPDGSSVRIINDAHLRICGLTRSQQHEPDIYTRITHPDDRALQQHYNEQIRAGSRRQFSMEKRYVHADGKVVWVSFSYQRETYPDGTTLELTTVVDISERKAAEERLRQLAVIVESSEDAIIGHNLAEVITSWNRGAETIFGYTAAEMVGQLVMKIYPAELRQEEQDIRARIIHGESLEHFQTERLRKDGRRIRISATISPLRDVQGNVVGAATIARDVTRQHMLEEQLRQAQKMEAIGQLAGGVAHDFNNILAVIQMQIELSKMEGGLSPELGGSLDEIQAAAKRGANLVRQLLLFSRRQRLQPKVLDLSDSITGMSTMLWRILGEDIQIQFKYAAQPLFIRADAGMMDQVLMNLTLNSRDAMPEGGQLVIETAAVELDELAALQSAQARPGSFVRLSVRDTGSGIPPEILPRIFEPFFTTKDVGKGTGLGLATVFSIVQQHQGWINVASQPGRGTAFDIYLPRLVQTSALPPEPAAAPAASAGGNETILLVEDDASLRGSVNKCLTQLGYRVLEAANGAEALELWQPHHAGIDLLLTDLVMPGGMNGKELGERLLRENPKLKVIYVSGYSAEVFTRDFPVAGNITFLPKPFAAQALTHAIRACLDKKSREKL